MKKGTVRETTHRSIQTHTHKTHPPTHTHTHSWTRASASIVSEKCAWTTGALRFNRLVVRSIIRISFILWPVGVLSIILLALFWKTNSVANERTNERTNERINAVNQFAPVTFSHYRTNERTNEGRNKINSFRAWIPLNVACVCVCVCVF